MPVYFIRAADGSGPVKIGWAIDPKKRLAEVQRMSPVRLCILATIEGGRDLEAELHRTFYQLRLWGEWFKAKGELLKFIGENMAPPPKSKQVKPEPEPEPEPFVQIDDPGFWTLEKVGQWISYSVKDVRWLIEEHGLPATYKDNELFVRPDDLDTWIKKQSANHRRAARIAGA